MDIPFMTHATPQQACDFIQSQVPGFTPYLSIILGSGLDEIVTTLDQVTHIPYADIPGFYTPNVVGHAGILSLGWLNRVPVVCLRGRAHYYEGDVSYYIKQTIRTLKLLGCQQLLLTNAAGSIRPEFAPGELALITDHINMQYINPLVGINDDNFGPRFPDMTHVYDLEMNKNIYKCAKHQSIILHEGVYVAVNGPQYETPAEIRAFERLGADLVGMSTVPEVLVAKHCGLTLATISMISNYATGISSKPHDHNHVLTTARKACQQISQLVDSYTNLLA